jgi:hypothetical protein
VSTLPVPIQILIIYGKERSRNKKVKHGTQSSLTGTDLPMHPANFAHDKVLFFPQPIQIAQLL